MRYILESSMYIIPQEIKTITFLLWIRAIRVCIRLGIPIASEQSHICSTRASLSVFSLSLLFFSIFIKHFMQFHIDND